MRLFAVLSILVAGAFAQSQVPYAEFYGSTFSNREVQGSYPGTFSSLRKVDFRNFTFHDFDEAGKPYDSFTLKRGRYKHDEELGHQSIDLDSTYDLGRSTPSNGESIFVLLSWFAAEGSSSQGGIAQVFTLVNGKLRVIQEMNWDTHFQAGQPTKSFDASTKTLLARTAHYIPGDAHCCVSAMDVITVTWNGTRFVQTGFKTELSAYGKSEGKVLPR